MSEAGEGLLAGASRLLRCSALRLAAPALLAACGPARADASAPDAPAALPAQAVQASQAAPHGASPPVAAGHSGELLFVRGAAPHAELVVLQVADGSQRVLAAAAGASAAAWSPDGARIACVAPHDGHASLAALAADGGDLHWLAPALVPEHVCWEPDGRALLIDAVSADPSQADPATARPPSVWRVAADGSEAPVRITADRLLAVSPDGAWLITQRTTDHVELSVLHRASDSLAPLAAALDYDGAAFARAGDELFLGRRHASGARQIVGTSWPVLGWHGVTEGTADSRPAPSPDGKQLAFVRTSADGRDELCVRDLGTRHERTLPLDAARHADETALGPPQWSPDGTLLALAAGSVSADAPRRLLLLELASGSVRDLAAAGADGRAAPLDGIAWRPAPAAPKAPGSGTAPR